MGRILRSAKRYNSSMSIEAKWIKDARLSAGLSQEKLATEMMRRLNRRFDRSVVQKMEGEGRRVKADEMVAVHQITGHPLPSSEPLAVAPTQAIDHLPPGAIIVPDEKLIPAAIDVPVYGVAAGNGSGDGSFRLEEHAVDYVRRPPGIARAKDVYAVYVTGESMYPVYRHGTLLFIAPGRPISIGDDVLICLHPKEQGEPDEYLIKRLVRRGSDTLQVEQFNPPLPLNFPVERVKRLHKVLEARELVGI